MDSMAGNTIVLNRGGTRNWTVVRSQGFSSLLVADWSPLLCSERPCFLSEEQFSLVLLLLILP